MVNERNVIAFILYTTPLSKVISDSSSSHKLYADDTQLYISFSAIDFSHNIAHLEQTVSNFYSWMTKFFELFWKTNDDKFSF